MLSFVRTTDELGEMAKVTYPDQSQVLIQLLLNQLLSNEDKVVGTSIVYSCFHLPSVLKGIYEKHFLLKIGL